MWLVRSPRSPAIGAASFGRAEQHEPNALSCPPGRSPVLTGLDLREGDLCPSGHKVAQLPNSPSSWKNSRNPCCQGSFQRIADLSVSSRRKLHRAQPLVQQLVFFEKRVTQSFAFR